jgi:hypothetical protein
LRRLAENNRLADPDRKARCEDEQHGLGCEYQRVGQPD